MSAQQLINQYIKALKMEVDCISGTLATSCKPAHCNKQRTELTAFQFEISAKGKGAVVSHLLS
jgi:hypothetical protein